MCRGTRTTCVLCNILCRARGRRAENDFGVAMGVNSGENSVRFLLPVLTAAAGWPAERFNSERASRGFFSFFSDNTRNTRPILYCIARCTLTRVTLRTKIEVRARAEECDVKNAYCSGGGGGTVTFNTI